MHTTHISIAHAVQLGGGAYISSVYHPPIVEMLFSQLVILLGQMMDELGKLNRKLGARVM